MNAADVATVVGHGLEMIAEIVKTLRNVHEGTVKPEDALGQLEKLHARITADRAAADKALRARFPEASK